MPLAKNFSPKVGPTLCWEIRLTGTGKAPELSLLHQEFGFFRSKLAGNLGASAGNFFPDIGNAYRLTIQEYGNCFSDIFFGQFGKKFSALVVELQRDDRLKRSFD